MLSTTRPQALPLFLGVVALLVGEIALQETMAMKFQSNERKEEFDHELITEGEEQLPDEVEARTAGSKGEALREINEAKQQALREVEARKRKALWEVEERMQKAVRVVEARMQKAVGVVEARMQKAVRVVEERMQKAVVVVEERNKEAVRVVEAREQEAVRVVEAREQEALGKVEAVKQEALTQVDARKKQAVRVVEERKQEAVRVVEAREQEALGKVEAMKQEALTQVDARKKQALKDVDAKQQQALEEVDKEVDKRKQQALKAINAAKRQALKEINKEKEELNKGCGCWMIKQSKPELLGVTGTLPACTGKPKVRKNYTLFLKEVTHLEAVAICERKGGRLALPMVGAAECLAHGRGELKTPLQVQGSSSSPGNTGNHLKNPTCFTNGLGPTILGPQLTYRCYKSKRIKKNRVWLLDLDLLMEVKFRLNSQSLRFLGL